MPIPPDNQHPDTSQRDAAAGDDLVHQTALRLAAYHRSRARMRRMALVGGLLGTLSIGVPLLLWLLGLIDLTALPCWASQR